MGVQYSATFDLMQRVILTPAIQRVYWSAERAWPGGAVKLCVETRHVPNGSSVALEIRSARLGLDGPIVHTPDPATIENSRGLVEHEIAWDGKRLTELFDLGDLDCRFTIHATIDRYALTAISAPLYVALDPFIASY